MKIIYFILLLKNLIYFSRAQVNGKFGYPGKPYKAKLEPDNKLIYSEGEEVTYECTDFWSSIQTRKCERGRWTGKVPRCGDFVDGIIMKDVKVEDIKIPDKPVLKFQHKNMTIINTQWKYPNAFTSNRFPKARLRIFNANIYKWSFNFTAPTVKLFVRISFNFINYTLLTPEQKQNFTFNITMFVSPERKCVLNHQSDDKWRENGRKIDSEFTCDSHSLEAYNRDVDNPGDYMFMETQASIGLDHDLIAVFFGKPYGTFKEPICGEPEVSVSHLSRFNQQYIYYSIDCKDKVFTHAAEFTEKNVGLKCKGDMNWVGIYPKCIPIKPCPLNNLLIGSNSSLTVINSFDGIYFFNDSYYYAYEGTEVNYGCLNPGVDILLGKETRTCLKNGTWSNKEPYCYDLNDKFSLLMIIGILVGSLALVIVMTGILFYIYTKRNKEKMQRKIENQKSLETDGSDEYDDIDTNHTGGKEVHDTYDVTRDEEEEFHYADPYYTAVQDYNSPTQTSDNYWRISTEPDYLEMTAAYEPNPRCIQTKDEKSKL